MDDPNYRFSMNFDNMVIQVHLTEIIDLSYKLVNGGWNLGNAREKSYYYNGSDTSAAGNHISSVQYCFIKAEILFLSQMQDIIKLIELKDFIFIDLTERLWDWYILIII